MFHVCFTCFRTHLATLPKIAAFSSLAGSRNTLARGGSLLATSAAEFQSLKRCLHLCVCFACDLHSFIVASLSFSSGPGTPLADAIFPLLTDAVSEEVSGVVALTMQPIVSNREIYDSLVYSRALALLAPIIQNAGSYQVRDNNNMTIPMTVRNTF